MSILGWWGICAGVLLVAAGLLGAWVRNKPLGILVDNRGRYSLAHFQMVTWTIVVLSLIAAVTVARVLNPASQATALEFAIPSTLLLVMGISLGSAVGASAIKGTKDQARPDAIAASNDDDKPRLLQLFTLEEGALADKAIDIGKFQNFWLTLILVMGYVALTVSQLRGVEANLITALPDFTDSMITLLAISHAGYLANKLPNRNGAPDGLSVAKRNAGYTADRSVTPAAAAAGTYVPRNP